jgi:hypothetical protein
LGLLTRLKTRTSPNTFSPHTFFLMHARTKTACFAAGALAQGLLLLLYDAALARQTACLALLYAACTLVMADGRIFRCLGPRTGRRPSVPLMVWTCLPMVVWVCAEVLLAWDVTVVAWTQFRWLGAVWIAVRFLLAIRSVVPLWPAARKVSDVLDWVVWKVRTSANSHNWVCRQALDVVEWTARAFMVHVPTVMFPATCAVVALWQEVDQGLSRAEEDDRLAVFTAAQTGQHHVLDKLLLYRSSSWQVWWRYVFSRTASHRSRARFQRALCAAAANGQVECVRRLLDAGAHADWTCVFGAMKPAEHAARSDEADTLQVLLAAKASVYTGMLALAAENGASADVVRQLLDASDENVNLGSALAEAAKHHHDPKVVHMLLEAKASVHDPVHWAYTGRAVLYYAAKNVTAQRTAIVQLLLDAKAHVNYDDRDEKSPLDVAATDDVAALLRAHGARRNVEIFP